MNNDLISREALKRTACVKFYTSPYYKHILDLIDNAPTVEQPQGEWIIDGHHIRCNRCNEYICNTDREGNKIPDNFCSNCGADMRGAEK